MFVQIPPGFSGRRSPRSPRSPRSATMAPGAWFRWSHWNRDGMRWNEINLVNLGFIWEFGRGAFLADHKTFTRHSQDMHKRSQDICKTSEKSHSSWTVSWALLGCWDRCRDTGMVLKHWRWSGAAKDSKRLLSKHGHVVGFLCVPHKACVQRCGNTDWAIWAQRPSATFRIGQHATVHRKELQKGGKYGKYEQILVHVWYTLSKPHLLQTCSKDHLLPGQYEETKSVQHLDRLSLFERGLGRLQPFGRATVPGSPDKRSSTIKDVNVTVCTYFSIYAHRWIYSSVSISLYIYNYI